MTSGFSLAYRRNTYDIPGAFVEYIMTEYYDYVLALIPMVLLGIGGALFVAGVPQTLAVSLAGTTAIGMIGHAIFVNGPVSTGSGSARTETSPAPANGPAVQAD